MHRQRIGLKHILVICSEMTCALFAHIATSATSRDHTGADLLCHNVFSALNLRKLQYVVGFDAVQMIATFAQGNAVK